MSDESYDIPFYQLVISLQAAAYSQLGKTAHPVSGKIERDIAMAKHTIDLLDMLERKTRGNLTDDEARLLSHVLFELRMNYVEESRKSGEPASSGETQEGSTI